MRIAVAVGLLAALLAGCGGGGGPAGSIGATTRAVAGLRGQARTAALLRRARREGTVLRYYTSLDESVSRPLVAAFHRATGIRVSLFRAKSEDVTTRVAKEARAGFSGGADVVETNDEGLSVLAAQGAFARYVPPVAGGLRPGSARDRWTDDRLEEFVVARNTDRVSAGQAPRSFADLAGPGWHGRLGIELGDADWYMALRAWWAKREGLSAAAADRRMSAIAANARAVDGHTLLTQLLADGEVDVAVDDYSYMVNAARATGAPVATVSAVGPTVTRANGVAILRATRHPAAAVLFTDWLLGPGQAVLARHGVPVLRRDLARPPRQEAPIDVRAFVAGQAEWKARYGRILRTAAR